MKLLGQRPSERGLYALVAVGALLVIYVVAFVVSNSGSVSLSFVLFHGSLPLILLMVICVALGVGLGVALTRIVARVRPPS